MQRNELPENCLSVLEGTGQLILIKRGEKGYYPSELDTGSRPENRRTADHYNERRGITIFQEEAMKAGSLFGWTVPGASPQWHLDHAKMSKTLLSRGHIKDPVMSLLYPFRDFLIRYDMGGRESFYLPLSAFPKELMGAGSRYILLPDLVGGIPVMPVSVAVSENGSKTVCLAKGSFSPAKEENAGYQIVAKVSTGSTEFVLAEHPTAPSPFATWQRNLKNDQNGPPQYFWGHYGGNRDTMLEDFCERANRQYEQTQDKLKHRQVERGDAR